MAALVGLFARSIPSLIKVGSTAYSKNNADKEFRNRWTQQQASELSAANPGKNIMIVGVAHTQAFTECQTSDLICQVDGGGSHKYTLYIFDEGEFELQGDGGYLNWAFTGWFRRDGSKVVFTRP